MVEMGRMRVRGPGGERVKRVGVRGRKDMNAVQGI